jgi:chemotaxis protein methyltransferase CheR
MDVPSIASLKRSTFQRLQRRFAELSGIKLAESKQFLLVARLRSRLTALNLASFEAYGDYLELGHDAEELQCFVDLLTTNETYFFREPHHFRFLHEYAVTRARGGGAPALRVWSAAASTGEEPYSLAMTLLDALSPNAFQVVASDLSSRVLDRARRGIFPMQRLEHIPPTYLQRFCERGKDQFEGSLRVTAQVKTKVEFYPHNLMDSPAAFGRFDVVFLRNVLIYFDRAERERILDHVLRALMPRGYLILGTSESVAGLSVPLTRLDSSIYERSR